MMRTPGTDEPLFPGGFRKPTSVVISGPSRTLLKWFAFAALDAYSSRVYWTEVRLPGEVLEPLDPMAVRAIRPEAVYILSPDELAPNDQGARQARAAAAMMLRSDETRHSLEGLVEFIRMPSHAQRLIAATARPEAPSILVTANAQRLAGVYTAERVGPLMQALLSAGTCQVALWAEAATSHLSMFEVILRLEGRDPLAWRDATVQCEKGISTGPLAEGRPRRLSEIRQIRSILEGSIPGSDRRVA